MMVMVLIVVFDYFVRNTIWPIASCHPSFYPSPWQRCVRSYTAAYDATACPTDAAVSAVVQVTVTVLPLFVCALVNPALLCPPFFGASLTFAVFSYRFRSDCDSRRVSDAVTTAVLS